jgi:hypothetical protein
MATRYNVVAAFPDEQRAQRAVHRLTEAGVDKRHLRLVMPGGNDDPDRVAVMRAEMQDERVLVHDETADAFNGVFVGTLVGGLVGLVVGVVWALLGHGPLGPTARSLIVFMPFAIAGAVIGAIRGGALGPDNGARSRRSPRDDESLAAERDTLVAVHVADARTAERAQNVLEELGAERVDAIDADGTPLPPEKY